MTNIKVVVRTRPLHRPREENCILSMTPKSTTICLPSKRGPLFQSAEDKNSTSNSLRTFHYDRCFWSIPDFNSENYASQADVFESVGKDVLDNAFDGYNSCVFAYGQTGSGKSYSMMGTAEDPGLIPRMASELFQRIECWEDSRDSFKVEVCYFEIYNEKVRDLLQANGQVKKHYRVREHPTEGPYVDGLTKFEVNTYHDIEECLSMGNKARTVAETAMNDQSSRSHAILTITLTRIKYEPDLDVHHQRTSKINLIDLAGSERAGISKTSGQRLKEGGNINKSLTSLGLVIKALVEKSKSQSLGKPGKIFVPYRDSILTWLLRECLGGNSKTVMLATVSPSDLHAEETLSTLRYADSAKSIINAAVINEDPKAKIIQKLLDEVNHLKSLLSNKNDNGNSGNNEAELEIKKYRDEIDKLKQQLRAKEMDVENLRQERHRPNNLTSSSATLEFSTTPTPAPNFTSENFDFQIDGIERKNSATSTISARKLSIQDLGNTPHLVNLTDDPLCSDVLIHYLQQGETKIGSSPHQDIVLRSDLIDPQHCTVEMHQNNIVFISPSHRNNGNTKYSSIDEDLMNNLPEDALKSLFPSRPESSVIYVNGKKIESKTRIKHGSRILLGRTHLFRFNHPQEAYILRQKRISEISSVSSSPRSSSMSGLSSDSESEVISQTRSFSDASPVKTKRFSSVVSVNDYESEDQDRSLLQFPIDTIGDTPFDSVIDLQTQLDQEARLNTTMEDLKTDFESKRKSSIDPSSIPKLEKSPTIILNNNAQSKIPPFPVDIDSQIPSVQITIPKTELVGTDGPKKFSFYLYHIKIVFRFKGKTEEWTVKRRYSHIYDFYKNVKAPVLISNTFPTYSIAENLGSLVGIAPTKMIETRRRKLETYFNALVNWWINEWLSFQGEVKSSDLKDHLPVLCPERQLDMSNSHWIKATRPLNPLN